MRLPRQRSGIALALLAGASIGAWATPPPREDKPAAAPARATIRDVVGQIVPPYPMALQSNTGACIGSNDDPDGICGRNIGTLDDAAGVTRYLYAGKSAGQRDDLPLWRVLDVATLPALLPHEFLQIGTCQRNGEADESIAALVDPRGAEEVIEDVRWAVRFDRATHQFVQVPSVAVTCINEGFGE